MNWDPWYPWLVLVHVIGAFTFVFAHGVSAHVSLKLRSERDSSRIAALLEISGISISMLYIGLLLLLVGGIAAGFVGNHWGHLWIWLAIGILVVMLGVMYAVASSYYAGLRRAAGLRGYGDKPGDPPSEPVSPEELMAMLASPRPYWLAAIGGIGLLLIIGLMVLQPV